MGKVGILNVGAGDTKLTFDTSKPDELRKSAAIVEDMIRRGFVLLIETGRDEKGPLYRRATGFDASTAEYIIAGPSAPQEITGNDEEPASAPKAGRKGKSGILRVAASSTDAVAVARTAGG